MTVDELHVDHEKLARICAKYGVARLDVFGSFARGDAGKGSDVDLLYELQPGATLGWGIEALSDDLADLFGRPVDLVAKHALHRELREPVMREAQPLYAA